MQPHESNDAPTEGLLAPDRALAALGALAAGMAHELNNVLFTIQMNAELACLDLPDTMDEQRTCLNEILAANRRGVALLQDVLAFARRGAESAGFLSMTPLAKETVQLVRRTFPARIAVGLVVEAAHDVVFASPVAVQQAITLACVAGGQMLGQAPGRLALVLSDRAAEPAANGQDVGSGHLPWLELRVEAVPSEPPAAESMDWPADIMALLRETVQRAAGSVTTEGTPCRGGVLRILLPAETPGAVLRADPDLPLPRGHESVLLVDDDPPVALAIAQTLRSLGYRVLTEYAPQPALEAFRRAPDGFDLVLTDRAMPLMTGDVLANEIGQIRPATPVVLMSGDDYLQTSASAGGCYLQAPALAGGKRQDGRAVLPKPVTCAQLAQAVRFALDGR